MKVVRTLSQTEIFDRAKILLQSSPSKGMEYESLLDASIASIMLEMLDIAEEHGIEVADVDCLRGFERPDWQLKDDDFADLIFSFRRPKDAFAFKLCVM